MAKSIDQIWKEMQQQQTERRQARDQEDQRIFEEREKARLEYVRRNKMYESVSSASSAAGGGGGGTPTIEYISIINTNWIYPQYDLDLAISTAIGLSPSFPMRRVNEGLSFPNLTKLLDFYEILFKQTEISQPNGNTGFSLGVGTVLRSKRNSRFCLKLDSGITVVEFTLMTQVTNQSDLPVGGDSPDGTVGWGLIYCDWNLNGVADSPGGSAPTIYADVLLFRINV